MADPASLRESVAADLVWKYDTTTGFAETVTGPSGDFAAIFSRDYLEAAGGEVGVASSVPMLRCRDADARERGDAVTVRGVVYRVVEVRPDGYGETLLRLHA